MDIHNAVMDPESDVRGSVLVLDIADSTKMKSEMDEVSWLGNYAKAFDLVVKSVPDFAEVVKYLGDGIMVYFPDGYYTDAINTAIRMQEELLHNYDKKRITTTMSSGIASGTFKRIPLSGDRADYLGTVVDRAFRLCSAATPRALFVDVDTVYSANIAQVQSEVGSVLGRSPAEYVGDEGKMELKGFSKLVQFHEIHWAKDRYGIKTSHGASDPQSRKNQNDQTQISNQQHSVPGHEQISRFGTFTFWRGHTGRVNAEDGEVMFCHKGSVLEGFEVKEGAEVFFIAEEQPDKPMNHASRIIPLGVELSGEVINVNGNNGFLRSSILTEHGHENVYAWVGDFEDPVQLHDNCTFSLGKGYSAPKHRTTPKAENLEIFEA